MRAASSTKTLGKYHLVVELARGGMGVVHLAASQGLGGFHKLVVVKELSPALAGRADLVEMFLEEARIAARLNHPNVVQTMEVGSERGLPYLVMEYLEGQSLRSVLRATEGGPKLPLAVHVQILLDTLAGLEHAHKLTDFQGQQLHVVHRDVSPHNLIVTYAGHTKLVDFGLARASDTLRKTRAGVLRGKLGYMAPEQLRGETLDHRADLFSVGVMLWEAASGQRMWKGQPELMVAQRLGKGDVPSLVKANPRVAPELARICDKALAPLVGDRYGSAAEMQADLEGFLRKQGKHATPRGVGGLVSELFAGERQRIHQVVESQLRILREAGPARTPVVSLVDAEEAARSATIAAAIEAALKDAPPSQRARAAQPISGAAARTMATDRPVVLNEGPVSAPNPLVVGPAPGALAPSSPVSTTPGSATPALPTGPLTVPGSEFPTERPVRGGAPLPPRGIPTPSGVINLATPRSMPAFAIPPTGSVPVSPASPLSASAPASDGPTAARDGSPHGDEAPTEERRAVSGPMAFAHSILAFSRSPAARSWSKRALALPVPWMMVAAVSLVISGIGFGLTVSSTDLSRRAMARGDEHASPASMRVTVRATPPEARLFVDGNLLPKNPHQGVLPRDGKAHTLRIEADGFVPATEDFVAERDLEIRIALEKK